MKPGSLDFGRHEIRMRCCDGMNLVVKFDIAVTDSVSVKCVSKSGEETDLQIGCDWKSVSCFVCLNRYVTVP
jgi:hypothetical protein